MSRTQRLTANIAGALQRHNLGLLLAIVIVVVVTTIADAQHNYLYDAKTSAINITRQTVLLGIFSLGAGLVIIAGGIDLSSGAVIAFSGTIYASLLLMIAPDAMQQGKPVGALAIILAITGALVVGFLIGSLHSWLITVIKLPPFIATLATLVGLRSLGRAICDNVTAFVSGKGSSTKINFFDPAILYLARSVWIPGLIFVVLAALMWLLLSRTVLGRHVYALGGNENAARLSGIRTDRVKWFAYCTSAVLSSIAGILYASDQSSASPQTLGLGYELNAIAAAVVGGCSLQGGVGTVPGIVLGTLFLRLVNDGVAKIIKTGSDVYEGLIVGIAVVLAVTLSQRQRGGTRTAFFAGSLGIVMIVVLSLLASVITAVMSTSNKSTSAIVAGVAALALLSLRKFLERKSPGERSA